MSEMAIPLDGALSPASWSADRDAEIDRQLSACGALAFRVAYAVLRQREDAEDVAQEALARACRKLPELRDRQRFQAWLVRICWRLALDHRRAARRRLAREQAAVPGGSSRSPEELAASSEARHKVWAAIDGLPEPFRLVVVLAGIQGHGVAEVAALLDLPAGTVKSRLHAARRRLAECLK